MYLNVFPVKWAQSFENLTTDLHGKCPCGESVEGMDSDPSSLPPSSLFLLERGQPVVCSG